MICTEYYSTIFRLIQVGWAFRIYPSRVDGFSRVGIRMFYLLLAAYVLVGAVRVINEDKSHRDFMEVGEFGEPHWFGYLFARECGEWPRIQNCFEEIKADDLVTCPRIGSTTSPRRFHVVDGNFIRCTALNTSMSVLVQSRGFREGLFCSRCGSNLYSRVYAGVLD